MLARTGTQAPRKVRGDVKEAPRMTFYIDWLWTNRDNFDSEVRQIGWEMIDCDTGSYKNDKLKLFYFFKLINIFKAISSLLKVPIQVTLWVRLGPRATS